MHEGSLENYRSDPNLIQSWILDINGTVSDYIELDSRFPYDFEVPRMP